MNIKQIEKNIKDLLDSFTSDNFIYQLLLAYGLPKASITRIKKGNLNMSDVESEISWKKKLFFKEEFTQDLHLIISNLEQSITHNERFIIVTDYETLLAVDTKTNGRLDCKIHELINHYAFFLPWAGMEKAQHVNENPADVKAAEKMAKLFDIIKKDNPDNSPEFIHSLNVFLSRLLFCYFAEDTHIFEDHQFTNSIDSHTQPDGSDLHSYLESLFLVLNTPKNERKDIPKYLDDFPYVNGGLFQDTAIIPTFSRSSRAAIINSGDQDWSAINPDIFGSMFQAVIGADQRGNLGQHYTSVPNIMKVIEPLFLNELYEELEKAGDDIKKLNKLLHRIQHIKIFDPACGSGNFLIIAYKELRLLEMKIFKAAKMLVLSGIKLSQFYGIEIDDFAGEIAKLALWLAEHQMNVEFYNEFGQTNPTLPLSEAGQIIQGNATRLNWEEVCPKKENDEIYILGNPPFQGFKSQDDSQKHDLSLLFKQVTNYKSIDYIACWFLKASNYLQINVKAAFVSTNSICQGSQVELLWPLIFSKGIEIFFAHTSFKWTNNAKSNAGVSIVIIGLQNESLKNKTLYTEQHSLDVKNINPYLINAKNIIVKKRRELLSDLPPISDGSGALDGGNLILSSEERENLLSLNNDIGKFIKPYLGSKEFINGLERWCIWIEDDSLEEAKHIDELRERINSVYLFRKSAGTRAKSALGRPHKFAWINQPKISQIIIPTVSSSNRKYIPIGFLDCDHIVSNSASIIHNPDPYVFGVISSRIHMLWVKTFAGRLKTDYRYTSGMCYNTFPFPKLSSQRKNEITQAVLRILEEREKYPEKTMAQLYDPDKMPDNLRDAHSQNDIIIEKCYRSIPFKSDEERLEYLFKLYEKMIKEEKELRN